MPTNLAYPIAGLCLIGIYLAAGWRAVVGAVAGVALGWALVTGRRLLRG